MSADTTSAASGAAPAPAAPAAPAAAAAPLIINHLTLTWTAQGGCFASDRMRDSYPSWTKLLADAGIGHTLVRHTGSPQELVVEATPAAGGAPLAPIVLYKTPEKWDSPWQHNDLATLMIRFCQTGVPPVAASP